MLNKLIRCCVAALVLYLVYILAGLLIAAIHAPAIALTVIACILVLIGFFLREFGIAL